MNFTPILKDNLERTQIEKLQEKQHELVWVKSEKVYTLRNSEFGFETLDCNESWGVLKYDVVENKTVTVEDKMDKASAIMVAKRLSAEDKDNIYTAVIVSDIVEKKIRVSPFKAFRDNETIGSIIKNFK